MLLLENKQQELTTKYQEPHTNQGIIGNRHPYTWGINPYIMFHSRMGNFTTNFPLARFLYPFFFSSILLGLEKNCTVFAFMFHSVTIMYCRCTNMWNSRFTPGHHSNTPRTYLWSLIDSLVTTAASWLFVVAASLWIGFWVSLIWVFFLLRGEMFSYFVLCFLQR